MLIEMEWISPPVKGIRPKSSGGWVQFGEWHIQGSRGVPDGTCNTTHTEHRGEPCVCLAPIGHEHPHFCCNPTAGWIITAVRRHLA